MNYTGKNGHYYETTGWWEIVNWKDIACELYNAIDVKNKSERAKMARKRFDKYW